jgi:hypothetical protein
MMDGARTANAVLFREMVEASFCMRIYFCQNKTKTAFLQKNPKTK